MNKFFKILIAGVFLTGFIASAICLADSSRVVMGSCHNKAQSAPSGDDSCFSNCLKQKISAISVGSQLSRELKSQADFFVKSLAPVDLQSVSVIPQVNPTRYISQFRFAPLFNHSPPLLL